MQLKTLTKVLIKQLFKPLLITLLLSLISDLSVAQFRCLTPQESSKQKSKYRSSISNEHLMQASYYLKIYVHVIRYTDGSGGFSDAEVEEILGYLDTSFNPHQIYFVWDNEIDYIDDDIRAIYGPGEYYDSYDIFSVNNHVDGIDIYLYPESTIAGFGQANGVGESSEFWVSSFLEGQASAKTFVTAHEMGHVLNLWHTHHSCETGIWELTDGSNCSTAGDFVCDTPSDPLIDYPTINTETCEWNYETFCFPPESPFNYMPDTKNIMSYSSIYCYEYFSDGQGERMRESIATLPYLQATITNVSSSACNEDDWNALKQLYNSTNGDDWTNNTNWDILKQDTIPEDCSLRGLHGITFDASGRVTAVNLYSNNLTGILPDEIGNLTNLTYLDLGFNNISGTLNEQIGNLSALEILFLDHNEFTGSIPFSFLNLDKLSQLSLQNNFLSGCFDVQFGEWCGRFTTNNFYAEDGTNSFDADFDTFCESAEGICPIERCDIEDWRSLKQLYNSTNGGNWTDNLNWVMVSGDLPPVDCDLRKLRGVSINVEGRVNGIDLFDNNLTGYLPYEIGNLTELNYVDLGYNLISDTLPSSLSNLDRLISLYLDNNNFTGNIPVSFAGMDSLSLLYLNNNSFTGCPDSSLSKLCTQLNEDYNKNKYLSEGNFLNIDWEDFCVFGTDSCDVSPCEADWFALKQLYLSTNGDNWDINSGWDIVLEESPPLENCNLDALYGVETNENGQVIEIDLTSNDLIGPIPAEIGNMKNLEILDLCINDLTGEIPNLSGLTNLTYLDLNDNQLSGSIPSTMGNLTSLEDLRLYNNQLSGTIPIELGNINSLIFLYLYKNELSGSIPAELGNLNNLELLYLYDNQLSGSVPPELGNLNNLSLLYLNLNQLTGTIPPELANLTNLLELSISNNLLTGGIPPEFGDLQFLLYLFLYNNDLSGCFDINLTNLCFLTLMDVDSGNNFDATWGDFCYTGAGLCVSSALICNSPPTLNINGLQMEAAIYHSAQEVSSNAIIKALTTYKAGETIELKSGFEADGQNNFQAEIEECE